MRLRRFSTAAGTTLLAGSLLLTLLAGPAGAAEGEVLIGGTNPEVVTDPAAGDCVSFTTMWGGAVENQTNARIAFYGGGNCEGDPTAVLEPGEYRTINEGTQVSTLQAAS